MHFVNFQLHRFKFLGFFSLGVKAPPFPAGQFKAEAYV